jgi:hypothetical protein
LYNDEAPKFSRIERVHVPAARLVQVFAADRRRPLEGIQANVDDHRHVGRDLFPRPALRLLEELEFADRARWFSLLYSKRWVLYAKRPFGGPQQVLSYLANYTHRVALSNRRIVAVDARHQIVTFTYRDYRHGSQRKELTLSALEFIRRFSLHILPPGLVRIRHYGIVGNNPPGSPESETTLWAAETYSTLGSDNLSLRHDRISGARSPTHDTMLPPAGKS